MPGPGQKFPDVSLLPPPKSLLEMASSAAAANLQKAPGFVTRSNDTWSAGLRGGNPKASAYGKWSWADDGPSRFQTGASLPGMLELMAYIESLKGRAQSMGGSATGIPVGGPGTLGVSADYRPLVDPGKEEMWKAMLTYGGSF